MSQSQNNVDEEAEQRRAIYARKVKGKFVNIGLQKRKWLDIKSKKGCKSDEDLAKFLIKSLHQLNKRNRVYYPGNPPDTRKRKIFAQHSHRVLMLQNDVWVRWRELKSSLKINCNSQLAMALMDAWYDRGNCVKSLEVPELQDNVQGYKDISSSATNTNTWPELSQTVKVEYVTNESAENSESDREIDYTMNYSKVEKKVIKLNEAQTENSMLEKRRKSSRVQSRGYRPDYANLEWKGESDSDTENNDLKSEVNKDILKQTNKSKRWETLENSDTDEGDGFIDNMLSIWGEKGNTKRQRKRTRNRAEEDPDFVVSEDDIKELDVSDEEKESIDGCVSYNNRTVNDDHEEEIKNESLSETEKKTFRKRRKNKTDSSVNKQYKRKRMKKGKNDEEENEFDKIENKSKAKKKIKKDKSDDTENVKKPWVHIKLEEHQEKYRMEVVGSFERKNRNSNLTEELYTCLMCGRFKSTAKDIFEEHVEKHVNKVLECNRCTYVGRSEVELMRHKISSGHMPKGHQYMCDICGMVLYTWDSRLSHMGKEHDDPQFKCKFCEEKFVTRLKRQQHTRTIHADLAQFCNSCKTDCQMLSLEEFRAHQNSCKPGHQCQVCGIVLASKSGLSSHIRATHMGVRKYQCQMCPYAGKSAQRLREHEMTHNSVHPYSCDRCTFTCVQACQLKSHMRTHSGEKPYKCSQCKFAAAWNVQLKEHIKIHGMETSVVCLQCDILFKNEKALKMHEKKDHARLSLNTEVGSCFSSNF